MNEHVNEHVNEHPTAGIVAGSNLGAASGNRAGVVVAEGTEHNVLSMCDLLKPRLDANGRPRWLMNRVLEQ